MGEYRIGKKREEMLEAVIEEQFSLVEGRRVKVRDKPRESAAHCQKEHSVESSLQGRK